MLTNLQQKILKNVIDANLSKEKSCIVNFSRFDKAEIILVKQLFELDMIVREIKPSDIQVKWSEMINSSQVDITFVAQAQYANIYMNELFPAVIKKSGKKP